MIYAYDLLEINFTSQHEIRNFYNVIMFANDYYLEHKEKFTEDEVRLMKHLIEITKIRY